MSVYVESEKFSTRLQEHLNKHKEELLRLLKENAPESELKRAITGRLGKLKTSLATLYYSEMHDIQHKEEMKYYGYKVKFEDWKDLLKQFKDMLQECAEKEEEKIE